MPAVATTANPDFTVASPSPGAAGQVLALDAATQQSGQLAQIDSTQQANQVNATFNQYQMPQLQSSIGAAGQAYSGAPKANAIGQANQQNQFQNNDIRSALGRQLDDLDRQRTFAATGLIV